MIQWAVEENRLSGRAVHELLAERAPAAEAEIYRILAEFLGVEFEPLAGVELDEDLARFLPSQFALSLNIAPVCKRLTRQNNFNYKLAMAPELASVLDQALSLAKAKDAQEGN